MVSTTIQLEDTITFLRLHLPSTLSQVLVQGIAVSYQLWPMTQVRAIRKQEFKSNLCRGEYAVWCYKMMQLPTP